MASTTTEIERKYEAPDGASLPTFETLDRVDHVETTDQELEAAYFDTAALDLAAAGITLRRRTGGDDAGWHLKLPQGDGARHELGLPLARAAKTPPKPFRDTVLLHTRGRPLRQVAVLRTHRTAHRLCDADGRVLAIACDDTVTAHTPAPADTGVMKAWREWEVELADGPSGLLERAEDLLTAAGGTPAASPSKLRRVLGDRLPEPPSTRRVEPCLDGAAALTVHVRLAEQVAEIKRRDPQVRQDLPDSVHQMRVAMRRLRSALATFRPLVDREVTEPLREELKWLSGVLGEARDREVIHERLRSRLDEQPVELLLGPVQRRIDEDFSTAYRDAHERSVEAMRSDRYFSLMDRLDALVEDPPWTAAADQPAADVLPRRMRKEWKRVRGRVRSVEEAPDNTERDHRLHDVRKAAKRARYAAESVRVLYGADAKRFVRAMKSVQSVLGDHQDSVVTQDLLRRLGVQAYLEGDNGFSYGLLHGLEHAHAVKCRAGFARKWRKAERKKLRRWFA